MHCNRCVQITWENWFRDPVTWVCLQIGGVSHPQDSTGKSQCSLSKCHSLGVNIPCSDPKINSQADISHCSQFSVWSFPKSWGYPQLSSIWVNYNISLTWIVRLFGDIFPKINHDFQGSVVIIFPDPCYFRIFHTPSIPKSWDPLLQLRAKIHDFAETLWREWMACSL